MFDIGHISYGTVQLGAEELVAALHRNDVYRKGDWHSRDPGGFDDCLKRGGYGLTV